MLKKANHANFGQCKLCGAEGELRKSHILPEFLYKPLYDENHCFMAMSPCPSNITRKLQKGIRERLLCDLCEGQLAVYEKYVKEAIYDGKNVTGEWQGNKVVLHGLDYKITRLYYLSLLWRMSISSDPMFLNVNLGPHEKHLRSMIRNEIPGEPEEYGFFCIIPFFEGELLEDLILQPEWVRINGHRFYRIVIGGLLYYFTLNSDAIKPVSRGALIHKTGDWLMLTQKLEEIPFLYEWVKDQARVLQAEKAIASN